MAKFEFERKMEGYNELSDEQLFSFWATYQTKIEAVEKEIADYKAAHKWERSNPARTKFMRDKQEEIDSLRYPQNILVEEMKERDILQDLEIYLRNAD